MSARVSETKKLPEKREKAKVSGMVAPHKEVVSRSRPVLGVLGFVLSLCGLALFWIPLAGILLWASGFGISLAAVFVPGARGFGRAGMVTAAISFVYMFFFLVAPDLNPLRARGEADGRVVAQSVSGGDAVSAKSKKTLADIFSSFGYRNSEKSSSETESQGEAVAAAEEPEDESLSEILSEEKVFPEGETHTPSEARNVRSARPVATETHARLPIARFAEIAKQRTTWPRSVRLMRSRKISLWDAEHKVIMGKMEIPAKSVVVILDVKSDGSLLVLDCTGQVFNVLAADTDFADAYAVKNAGWEL